ncbi:efflux RND transporter periplasmic adaptor subunit [Apibacter muscae]|uniref:Efflux RND transporter periplasmic adaptor subunit n=1 Tax=Apibacter muscae TaxID=2509004 RepID=A0A563D8I5_9FLAO|nr:efflux RND transporter periplasmic adaptor subunit [Apibacter muscae]TWP26556.1 efflux RND transporter periplasmic adaptor subunit [Apibacter muscae]TWP28130.1 efflux RND transporter periplasmic adaptor subunit [Apibacter muscae]
MKTNKIKILVIAIISIVSIFFIYKYFFSASKPTLSVETVKVEKGNVSEAITATGTVNPVNEVTVGTQVSGIIEKIYVDYNSPVKKGQLIAQIDRTNLLATLTDAQATYSSALNQLSYQQQNFNRQKNMYNAQVISKADFETASFSLNDAKESVKQAKSTLQKAQTNLGYANIYSPIDGVIVTKEVEEGQTVAASMSTPTLFTIAQDLTKMQVEANVDEADIGNVQVGQRVTFTVDAYPSITFNGTVNQVRLGATVTSNVVTYTVIIVTDNSNLKLKPGLTATVTIYTKELNDIITLPAKALNFTMDPKILEIYNKEHQLNTKISTINKSNDDDKYVWIRNKQGILEQKLVKIGESDGINVEVISGLKVGDEVVYSMKNKQDGTSSNKQESSPFMPKRPGASKKK